MVDAVVNVLLQTLRAVLVEEVTFLSGVGNKVKKTERDLKTIHGLLMDADRKRIDSRSLQNCIDELKDLAIKAENVLEKYAVEVQSKKEGKSLKTKLQRFIGILGEWYSVYQVGNEIDDIRSSLTELTNKLSSIKGGEGPLNPAHEEQQRLLRLRYAHEIEQHFVGMEKDIECVVSLVNDEPGRSPKVTSICGMGGLGKTTLARKVYHHQNVVRRFGGRRIWVCVTQQFQADTILRSIYRQIDKEDWVPIDIMSSDELVIKLFRLLEKRDWLIVIDDIWQSPHWAILKHAFPSNCKVLLTTRNENIDVASDKEFRAHKLDLLSEDDGWELLRRKALPINDDATSEAFEIEGRLIVQRCGRLPLAISVIGGILHQKQQILIEWRNVSDNIQVYLMNGNGIGNDINGVKLVLDLSFDVLPYYLKPCFLYMSCFPEDKEINTEELYLLWMAEGLISSEEKGNGETLRDVAERYLAELAYRSMVQGEKDINDFTPRKFTSCRLHDLMRDLCISKAVEMMFFKRIEISKPQNDLPFIDRVAINLEDDDDTLKGRCMPELKHLRSFLIFSRDYGKMVNVENMVNLADSKQLKILVFHRIQVGEEKLPRAVSKLIHLRYLGLNGCYVKELPHYVFYLPFITTLDLRVNDCMKLPNLIWKMKRLRHLFLCDTIEVIGGDKLKLKGLKELETLVGISSRTAYIEDVNELMNLRLLSATIDNVDNLSKFVKYLSNNQRKLLKTHLCVESCDIVHVGYGVKEMLMSPLLVDLDISFHNVWIFPCYEQGMCTNLVKLEIDSSLIGELVEELGKYPVLQSLKLIGDKEVRMKFVANSFPELKTLSLYKFLRLRYWDMEEGAMPKLRELCLVECLQLVKLPDRLRFIPTLQELKGCMVSPELRARMKCEGAGIMARIMTNFPTYLILILSIE